MAKIKTNWNKNSIEKRSYQSKWAAKICRKLQKQREQKYKKLKHVSDQDQKTRLKMRSEKCVDICEIRLEQSCGQASTHRPGPKFKIVISKSKTTLGSVRFDKV